MYKAWLKSWLWWTRKRHPDMERFSDESKICFARANQIAASADSKYLSSVHLMLAILQTPINDSIGANGELKAALESVNMKEPGSHSEPLKRAIEIAIEYARTIGTKEITPVLLLYGISQIPETLATQVLNANGITSEKIQALIVQH